MLTVGNILTALAWLLLCGNLTIVVYAAFEEFAPSATVPEAVLDGKVLLELPKSGENAQRNSWQGG